MASSSYCSSTPPTPSSPSSSSLSSKLHRRPHLLPCFSHSLHPPLPSSFLRLCPARTGPKHVPSLFCSCRGRHHHLASAASSPPNPSGDEDEGPHNPQGLLVTLGRARDGLRIFFAVLFWISLFFWASAWDGKDGSGPKKGSRFRR